MHQPGMKKSLLQAEPLERVDDARHRHLGPVSEPDAMATRLCAVSGK